MTKRYNRIWGTIHTLYMYVRTYIHVHVCSTYDFVCNRKEILRVVVVLRVVLGSGNERDLRSLVRMRVV